MLTRIPINLLGFWKITDNIRLGVGVTTHQFVKLNGDDFLRDVDYKSTLGSRFEIGYKWIALTYTSINYKNDTNKLFSANSVGVCLSYGFPNKK